MTITSKVRETDKKFIMNKITQSVTYGPMNSSWPMRCHDNRHTGRSPYSTAENSHVEKWRLYTDTWAQGSPVIDNDGIIYFGSGDFYAVYPNGTFKWKYDTGIYIVSAPAVDENGTIYVGTTFAVQNYLYAFYPDGALKWKFKTDHVFSSPAIGSDGTVYFGEYYNKITALYPNGTLKWRYMTSYAVLSSPAIGDDETVYCGSHDGCLYALYPNGTLKWRFHTGGWVRASPSIADDGTIYAASYDGYLYALYPNGTLRWQLSCGGSDGNPSIAQDGTIYVGVDYLYAINPNGTVKWSFDLGPDRYIAFSCPAISADGTIYIGVCIGDSYNGGELIAVNPDGTEKWRSGNICSNGGIISSPAIAADGTIYICSLFDEQIGQSNYKGVGYLHAFGPGDIKHVTLDEPQGGWIYFYGRQIEKTQQGKTLLIGDFNVKINVTLPEEIEKVTLRLKSYYPGPSYRRVWMTYEDSEPPYEWRVDASDIKHIFNKYNIQVTAFYKGGCRWSDDMDVYIFHLL
ncbi:MAG: hypothetical protein BV458_13730 [Thermoplasmata archaeon M9B2D]|nr:MAG: hypothetical protein BV458_13730 [Thermoplasmata archaeon M9B2D]